MRKTVFVSDKSFDDATFKARNAGYEVIGKGRNKKGQFVVFARGSEKTSFDPSRFV